MRARVCYLVTRQHIPIGRVAELLADTYGATVSTGTIVAMVNEGSDMLDEFLADTTRSWVGHRSFAPTRPGYESRGACTGSTPRQRDCSPSTTTTPNAVSKP
jgi:hypothetical protein